MKTIILIDADNFTSGLSNVSKSRKQFRYVDYYKINTFVIEYLQKNLQYKNCSVHHLRTYYYTGKYTENLINRMEKSLKKETNPERKNALQNMIEKAKKSKKIQTEFLQLARDYYYFEIRDKPLQFSPSTLKIFQKGVDVQLAVDLVEFAYKNTFDIAVVLSGDIDLIESVRTTKNLGKHVIIFGDESVTSVEMRKESDMYINLRRLDSTQLDQISHQKKN
ncbi:MAG: NYN domain-containing protein [Candidatus Woesearchaeota archaeon]